MKEYVKPEIVIAVEGDGLVKTFNSIFTLDNDQDWEDGELGWESGTIDGTLPDDGDDDGW